MAQKTVPTNWTRDTRNILEHNYTELYSKYIGAGLDATEAKEKAVQAVADSLLAKDIAETTREEMLAIIREQTQNGDLAPEIAQARGSESTLGENLNSIKSNLAQKPDKGSITRADLDTSTDNKKLGLNNVNDEFRQALTGQAPVFNGLPSGSVVRDYIANSAVGNKEISEYLKDIIKSSERHLGSSEYGKIDEKTLLGPGLFGDPGSVNRLYVNAHPSTVSGRLTAQVKPRQGPEDVTIYILERGEGDSFRLVDSETIFDLVGSFYETTEFETNLIIEKGQYVGVYSTGVIYVDKNTPPPKRHFFLNGNDITKGEYSTFSTTGWDVGFFYEVGTEYGELTSIVEALQKGGGSVGNDLSITDFGADSTGESDSSEAIQRTIDEASVSGRSVYIPAGDYFIDKTIYIHSDVRLHGSGRKSFMFFNESNNLDSNEVDLIGVRNNIKSPIFVEGDNVELSNFRVEGQKNMNNPDRHSGIVFYNSNNCKALNLEVHEINFSGANSYGILTSSSRNIVIDGGVFSHTGYENIAIRDKSSHVLVTNTIQGKAWRTCMQTVRSSYVSFVDNIVRQDIVDNYETNSAITAHFSDNILISGNIVESTTERENMGAIQLVGGNTNITVINNEVYSNLMPFNATTTDQVIIKGNRFVSESERAFRLVQCNDSIVQANYLECKLPFAPNIELNGCENLIFDSNICEGRESREGLYVGTGSTFDELIGIRITNNTVYAAFDAITLRANIKNSVVTGNKIHSPNHVGIRTLDGSTGSVITANIIEARIPMNMNESDNMVSNNIEIPV